MRCNYNRIIDGGGFYDHGKNWHPNSCASAAEQSIEKHRKRKQDNSKTFLPEAAYQIDARETRHAHIGNHTIS